MNDQFQGRWRYRQALKADGKGLAMRRSVMRVILRKTDAHCVMHTVHAEKHGGAMHLHAGRMDVPTTVQDGVCKSRS